MKDAQVIPSDQVNHALVDVARIAKITRQLYERQQFAYLLLSHEWRVIEASANLTDYGFAELEIGTDARDSIDFLIGLDSNSTLDLPIVLSPTKLPLHIVLLPEDESLTIVLMDATGDYEQQQLVQQKANDNELLLAEQRRLTADLETTQSNLVKKNLELKEAGRLQSSFLSGVSHEFRTPLASLLGYVELLSDRFESQDKATSLDQLQVIQRSARHLLSLVENLLDHGKLDAGEMVLNTRPVNLQSLCEEVALILAPTATKKELEFILQVEPQPLPTCMLDDSRVRQILFNVVGNAIKFTDRGSVTLVVTATDNEIIIAVEDTGIGISEAELEQVVHPFWQSSQNDRPGTGLGLTITEQIVEMMGGNLSIRSQVDRGTRVEITVPSIHVADTSADEAQDAVAAPVTRRFLLAEDDPDIAALLVALLQEQGAEVVHVPNGELALAATLEQNFDVILMDLQMPVMDGYAATEKIRKSGNKTPVLVMTASAIESDRSRAVQAGCDGYLIKPVAIDEVIALADELIEGNPSAQG